MKIVHVAGMGSRASGAVRVVMDICDCLAQLGHDVEILSSSPRTEFELHIAPSGVRVSQCHIPKYGFGTLIPFQNWSAPDVSTGVTPDVIHFHGIFNPVHAFVAREAMIRGIPYVITPHGNLMREALKHHRLKKSIGNWMLFQKYVKGASCIHALGIEEANDIAEFAPGTRIEVVPNGLSTSFTDLTSEVACSDWPAQKVFLFLGRIDVNHKGLDIIIKAIALAADVFRHHSAEFWLTGPFHSVRDRRYIESLINRFTLDDIVRFTGPKYGSEKLDIFSQSNIFVHASRYEGMPVAILEAMSCGLPCLVTPGTNMGKVIETNLAGWVSQPSPVQLSERFEQILGPEWKDVRQKGRNARDLVNTEFRLEKTIAQLMVLYESLRT